MIHFSENENFVVLFWYLIWLKGKLKVLWNNFILKEDWIFLLCFFYFNDLQDSHNSLVFSIKNKFIHRITFATGSQ